jgi:2-oxoglutarate dehydrogenase E1 component
MTNPFEETSPLYGTNSIYIEELYELYLANPSNVDASWQSFFKEMGDSVNTVIKEHKGASWAPRNLSVVGAKDPELATKKPKAGFNKADSEKACKDSIGALMLIRAFKVRGNLLADLDPLGLKGVSSHPDLEPVTYGFSEADFDHPIYLAGAFGFEYATLNELIKSLKQTYCAKIGVEFMHIPDMEKRDWIASRMEAVRGRPQLDAKDKKTILEDIVKVEEFEQFLHRKFPGAKRFSAEGGEAVIAAMEKIIETSAGLGVKEVVIGMAHRGRLNVLTKVMGRKYASLLSEFMGNQALFSEDMDFSGDVKYHQGASSDRVFGENKMHLSLSANPSHLEAVNPVVAGRVRAKQDHMKDAERSQVMGLLIHGDAAFAGQGIVPETLALSDLTGYTTGGVMHIIINNQIGFTTNPSSARSSPYPSDIAKGAHAPIFHVNGDDPEAVVFVSKLAVEYRQKFKSDVVVDVFCYRRYGHNEGDEPFFTQPIMYSTIAAHPTPMNAYAQVLIEENIITEADFDNTRGKFRDFLESELKLAQAYKADEADWLKGRWLGLESPNRSFKIAETTGIALKKLKEIGNKLASYHKTLEINKKLIRLFDAKKKMLESGEGIDWAMGEALAYGTLLEEGYPVRLSGQDCIRGTFSHRHSGLFDQKTEEIYFPLNNLSEKQAGFEVMNSNLSEFAVLGFEYGYSVAEPNSLVIWEGQFGDFVNGAQVIIDQFITSGEIKWLRFSGLTMLLPHGYEGQGPEHSSARLERFLQACAEDNIQVVNCTTPANFFHVMRRQLHRKYRKPLVVMSPKSLLRHPACVSDLKDFDAGTSFKVVIPESQKIAATKDVRRVVLCSGKVYYDLLAEREKREINDVALVRLEQYYPFPEQSLIEAVKHYKNADVAWCQEEPENMGAWNFLDRKLEGMLGKAGIKGKRPVYVGRSAAASPAAGYPKIHNRQITEFMNEAFK